MKAGVTTIPDLPDATTPGSSKEGDGWQARPGVDRPLDSLPASYEDEDPSETTPLGAQLPSMTPLTHQPLPHQGIRQTGRSAIGAALRRGLGGARWSARGHSTKSRPIRTAEDAD